MQLIELDLRTGTERVLLAGWDRSPQNWTCDGDDLLLEAADRARQPL